MRSYSPVWLLVGALSTPIVSIAGQAPATPGPPPAVNPSPAPPSSAPASTKSTLEATVQKQREATLAAMQASVDRQRASVAASLAASIGKTGQPQAPAKNAFFTLPPLTPPVENSSTAFTMPESTIADVACDPVPEASIAPILLGAAQREGLEPKLLTAVIQEESAFRPCAISRKGAQGLMQLMPDTADRLSVKDPFDTKQNVDGGAKYLKELITRYSGNLALALGAYNAGPETVDRAGGVPPIPETTNYVNKILTRLGMQPPAVAVTTATVTDPVPPAAPRQ